MCVCVWGGGGGGRGVDRPKTVLLMCQRVRVCVCVFILALYIYFFFIMVNILFHNLLNFRYMYNEFYIPSVSLAVSVSELQSESDARSIPTGSCSSSTAISFLQYTCSIDTCSTHFAHSPGVMPYALFN